MEYVDAVEGLRTHRGHRVELRGHGDSFSLRPAFSATPAFRPRSEVIEARTRILNKHGYRVHISGMGGDEFLGQAVEARLLIADFMFHWQFSRAWRELMSWSLFWRQPLARLFFETLLVLFPASVRCRMGEIQVPDWINRDFAERKKLTFHLLSLADTPAFWPPAARDAFQTHSRLAGILTNVSPSIAEERYPFLDQELTEFLMSIPLEQQLRPGDRRSLMRRALAGIVPPKVLLRRTKQMESRGFLVTLNKHWMELQRMIEAPLSSRLGMTNESEFCRALEEMRNGHLVRESAILLRGMFLEVWLRAMQENGVISIKGALDDLGLKIPELARKAGPVRI
jgi:asparagine synthase (glutamine-hydrolysing)